MINRRQPKGTPGGGRFAPDTSGKKAPSLRPGGLTPATLEKKGETETELDSRFRKLREHMVLELVASYRVDPEKVSPDLTYGDLSSICDRFEEAYLDAKYSDNFSFTQPQECMEDAYMSLGYECIEAMRKAEDLSFDIEWVGPEYDPRDR